MIIQYYTILYMCIMRSLLLVVELHRVMRTWVFCFVMDCCVDLGLRCGLLVVVAQRTEGQCVFHFRVRAPTYMCYHVFGFV